MNRCRNASAKAYFGLTFTAYGPFLFSLLFAAGLHAEEIKNEDCLACHDTFQAGKFAASVHGSNLCTSCHRDIREIPHPDKLAPVDCSSCHRIEAEVFNASDHGKALAAGIPAASCVKCHADSHGILSSRDPHSPTYRLNIPKTCAFCHEDDKKMARYELLENRPLKSYSQTVHGKALIERGVMSAAVCTDCHGSHDLRAPTDPQSKMYRSRVPYTCGKCHENVLNTYLRSVHGKAALAGKLEAPVCTDCHGEHTIKSRLDPASRVYATSVSEKTCGTCHAAEKIVSKYRLPPDRVQTYLESYHGLASRQGVTTVANCASCHGAHDILPSRDPNSSVNKKNLPQTCGKCHPNAGRQLTKGSVHLAPSLDRDRIVFLVTVFYTFLIILVIGGMVLHNLLDFWAKLREHYLRKKEQSRTLRFTRNERAQHLVLLVSFALLAYTGFALKFPEVWWAVPFTAWDASHVWRGAIHRAMAVVFVGLCLYHVVYVLVTRRGRGQLVALVPGKEDFKDFADTWKRNLGLAKTKPVARRYGYAEKAEYWALVWGSFIMIVTGSMLVFENVSLKYLPKWVLDVATVIHYYEAVLATLAILVWHLYFTIFDPRHYPMNWSMWTGKSDDEKEE